jgi:hypothetical protein
MVRLGLRLGSTFSRSKATALVAGRRVTCKVATIIPNEPISGDWLKAHLAHSRHICFSNFRAWPSQRKIYRPPKYGLPLNIGQQLIEQWTARFDLAREPGHRKEIKKYFIPDPVFANSKKSRTSTF